MTGPTPLSAPEDDGLHDRLLRAGERWRADQPAVRVELPRQRSAVRSRVLAPLAAAAAVVAVTAGSVVLLDQGGSSRRPVPVTALVAQADARHPDVRAVHAGPGFAPPPEGPASRPVRPRAERDCRAGEASATLTLSGGTGTLRVDGGAPQEQPCSLPGTRPSLSVVDGDTTTGVVTEYPVQPDVPNPPVRPDALLQDRSPLSAAVRWSSWCGPRTGRVELLGLAADPVPVTVQGDLPSCRDRSGPARLERLSGGYSPTGIVGGDLAGLRVLVQYPDQLSPGSVHPYTVRLQNPTSDVISLRPCPSYLVSQENPPSGGATGGSSSADGAALPCDDLPAELAAGEEATVLLEARFGYQDLKLRGVQPLSTWWGIAGAEPYEQDLSLRFPEPPRPLADVPWKDTPAPPGAPRDPQVGDALPYSPLDPTIEGLPQQARAGETVRYTVRLTNTATGGPPVPLDPCPGFVQYLQVGVREQRRDLVDEHYLNCDAAPEALAAGTSVLLRMELTVPDDVVGQGSLTWKVGKLDNGGSPSDFAPLTVTR